MTLAIDVLIEPDAAITAQALAINERLRSWYPSGFALGDDARVHLTLVQCYVEQSGLADIERITNDVAASLAPATLTANELLVLGDPAADSVATVMFDVPATKALSALHQHLADALTPLSSHSGDKDAFVATADGEPIDAFTLSYVGPFLASQSGPNYFPHITLGQARRADAERLLATPFDPIEFNVDHVSIYQLGHYGTARRLLHRAPGVG